MSRFGYLALFLFTFFLQTPRSFAGEIAVFADPDPAHLNQSFRLTFESSKKIDATPDFTPLAINFEIIGSPSHKSSYSYVNGKVTHSTSWTVNLIPKRVGNVTIPPISFGRDWSSALPVTILAAAQSASGNQPDLFLQVEVTPARAYVQAQVLYVIRIYRIVEFSNAQLSNPELSAGDALIEKLGDDRTFRQRHNGKIYDVIERRYAVFPQRSGSLKFKPITLQGQVIQGRRSLFGFGTAGPIRRVQSEALEVEVQTIPADFPGAVWLPARELELRETWSIEPDEVRIGEPVTRTISLAAQGLTASQLPELKSTATTSSVRQYPDQPTLDDQKDADGIRGFRQEKLALVATEPGEVVIPELAVPWWNTSTDQLEIARLPSYRLNIQAPVVNPPVPAPGVIVAASLAEPAAAVPPSSNRWLLATVLLAIAWAATLVTWWWQAGRVRRPGDDTDRPQKMDLKKIKHLCQRGDLHSLKTALLTFGQVRWPANPPASLGAFADRCRNALRGELGALNRALYGIGAEKFDAMALWTALQDEAEARSGVVAPADDPLEPLYPQAS